jgi:hypothetical protein
MIKARKPVAAPPRATVGHTDRTDHILNKGGNYPKLITHRNIKLKPSYSTLNTYLKKKC